MKLKLIPFLIAAGIYGCTAPENTDTIRIGATMSQTGSYATQGIPARNGYLLCEDHINAAGGLLGRNLEFLILDDASSTQRVTELYEQLITDDKVDAIMGPYGSTLTEALAPVTEKHRMVHISPLAATASIWEQGYEYLFMVLPPANLFLNGLIDMAAENGYTRVAVIQEDALFPKAAGGGAVTRAQELGLDVLLHETYARGTSDFSALLKTIQQENIEVVAMSASTLSDFAAFVRQMKALNVDVAMFGNSGAVTEFQQELGDDAEFTFGLSAWEPGLPYPGADEFLRDYQAKFGVDPSFHAAGAYGSCQLFAEAARRAGTLNADEIRDELRKMEHQTIFGDFAVDENGVQTAHSGTFVQWQNGKKVVVWPADLAAEKAIIPAPEWEQR